MEIFKHLMKTQVKYICQFFATSKETMFVF